MKNEKKGSFLGLLPLIVFLVAYMGTGLGTGSFDNMPLMTGIAIASGVALLLNKRDKKTPFEEQIALYCKHGTYHSARKSDSARNLPDWMSVELLHGNIHGNRCRTHADCS